MRIIEKPHKSRHSFAAMLMVLLLTDALALISCNGNVHQFLSSPQVTPPAASAEPTATGEPTPGLVFYGTVLDAQGKGLEDVQIYRSFAAYSGKLIATTDANGQYTSQFYSIPGDEMVSVWAEKTGYTFSPENYYWRHYYGYEKRQCNFKAELP